MKIVEAKNRINQLENELAYLKEKKVINFEKTQPSSPKLKDIVEGKSNSKGVSDKYDHYIIKDDELDNEIMAREKEINSLERFMLNEIERLKKYDEIMLIEYYRETGLSWKQIDKLLYKASGYSRVKLYRNKKKKQNDTL